MCSVYCTRGFIAGWLAINRLLLELSHVFSDNFIFSLISARISSTMGPDVDFLEGTVSPYQIYTSDSHMSEAGSGLFVQADVPAGKEIFRVALPAVSAV